jgi:parvulin-like peptidyl-prolyl isomerase
MLSKPVLYLCFTGAAGVALAADVKVVEQIVAKVNNEIITLGDLDKERQQMLAELKRQQMPEAKFEETAKQNSNDVLRNKIDMLLLVQKAKEDNINVDQDVSKRVAQIQLESKISDTDKFHDWIHEQTGMSFEDFKQQMKDQMMTGEEVRRNVGSRIVIPQPELRKYYDAHKNEFVHQESVALREIFLSTEGKTPQQTTAIEKKAKELVERARKGENFGQLAHDNSNAETAANFGDLPDFKRGDLRKDIEDIVFTKERGFVTDPFKQPNGLLILKVEQHLPAGLQPFEQVENEIMEKLAGPKMQPMLREYLTKLRQDAFLEIRAGYVDTGAAPGKDTAWKDPAKLSPETVTKEEVAATPHRKRLLWMVPVPGKTGVKSKSSKS